MATTFVILRDLPLLRALVASAGQSQASTADLAGMTPSHLNMIVTGRRRVTTLARAAAIEDTLGVAHGTLFALPDDAAPLVRAYIPDGAA